MVAGIKPLAKLAINSALKQIPHLNVSKAKTFLQIVVQSKTQQKALATAANQGAKITLGGNLEPVTSAHIQAAAQSSLKNIAAAISAAKK